MQDQHPVWTFVSQSVRTVQEKYEKKGPRDSTLITEIVVTLISVRFPKTHPRNFHHKSFCLIAEQIQSFLAHKKCYYHKVVDTLGLFYVPKGIFATDFFNT